MSLQITDPLFLLSAQTGLSIDVLRETAGEGNDRPQSAQEALQIGEPIPIVFGRRRTVGANTHGGIFIAPKAAEGYFSNQANNNTLDYKYLLVLSQGELEQVIVNDVYQRSCRLGTTLNQAYDARAGTWAATNDITVVASTGMWRTPSFVGTGGTYDDLTTFSFESSVGLGDDTWSRQIFIFIRGGIEVTRILDATAGPSDNYIDLAKYLMTQSARIDSNLIDNAALTIAANFTDTNGFFFNGEVSDSQNLQDWLQKTAYNFLLRVTTTNGQLGLKPRLPYNVDYTIKTTAIQPLFTFTEDHITPDGFDIQYIALEDRQPTCAVVLWRQQPDSDFGLVRSIEIRIAGEAVDGPFTQLDLSNYCTTEAHAIKVGAYYVATRKFVTHHLRIKVRERNYNSLLTVGDLVRVRLRRETEEGDVEYHDRIYEIEKINKSLESYLVYDLTHFPIDDQGRSIVAQIVAGATGANETFSAGRGDFDCDVNNSTDAVGTDTSASSSPGTTDYGFDGNYTEGGYPGGENNPTDPLDTPSVPNYVAGPDEPEPEDELSISDAVIPCDNGVVNWYRVNKFTGDRELISTQTEPVLGSWNLTITTADIDYWIVAYGRCPDPGSDDGLGPEFQLGESNRVTLDPTQYSYVRFSGTVTDSSGTRQVVTDWVTYDGTTASPYLTVASAVTVVSGSYQPAVLLNGTDGFEYGNTFASWSPWVNYYNPSTQSWVGTSGVYSVPWRCNITVSSKQYAGSGSVGLYFGNIGGQGYTGSRAGFGTYPDPVPGINNYPYFYGNLGYSEQLVDGSVGGLWEFSNDAPLEKTVAAQWLGNGDDGNPYVPS